MNIDEISAQFNKAASDYDKQRRYFIPCFDDYYGTISYLAKIRNDFSSILDLGAGTGLLTQYLYSYFPDAQYTLVDISDKMLEIAHKRFSGIENISYSICNYSEGLPDKEFDLIASALSIHHLDEGKKNKLYHNVYGKLKNNGVFINLDQFNASSEVMNNFYNAWWYDYICKSSIGDVERDGWRMRRKLDQENTIEETMGMLREAGFKIVECIYCYMKFGVVVAIK